MVVTCFQLNYDVGHPRSTATKPILLFLYAALWIGLVIAGLVELGRGDPSGWLYLAAALVVTGALWFWGRRLAASRRARGGESPGPDA